MRYGTGIDQGDPVSPPLQLQCSRQTEYARPHHDNRLSAASNRGRASHSYDQVTMETAVMLA